VPFQEALNVARQFFDDRLDGLILNAGTLTISRLEHMDLQKLRDEFEVNTFSLVSIIRHALPALRRSKGRVIFNSSGAATDYGRPGWGAYSASKAALNSICRTLASEEPDVATFALRPGQVDTEVSLLVILTLGRRH